ncbi:N-acyl homoserine lactonase family protein [Phycicoccus endophyticus]|uniref:N-acyl homoserine lactonase family protein n=1 Tax=Phycicoccus endophyticus TaxID=1690220 RepID=A0A7G9QZC6_9MICO|nr:N-acyl homoserine lactonase family protein [Phycicoccus endophyticus]NHI19056.1 N-acyl homoserine lactonase family protein [Phycicoccus endophyticus]QNN48701.1 N-acyl homoserine lactonase family protein [Phycicoccus endophyticus]GGL32515.1 MBL fold metallo-hydrolase [Phycicoccus endophyticus]
MTTPEYEVLALRYATRETTTSQVYLNHHMYPGAADEPVVMDYFVWVVRHGERCIVVDTGFTPEVGEARGRRTTTSVPDGLRQVGVDPEAVDTVVITHGHYDHTGHTHLFPRATFVISGRELDFWTGPVARRPLFAGSAQWGDIEALATLEAQGRVARMAGVKDVAPGVTVLEVGGHTVGQLVVLVSGGDGEVLLASDAAHYYDEVTLDRPFVIVHDLERMYQAFDVLSDLGRRQGLSLVAGHDPAVLERFPAISPTDPGLGVRVG